MLYVYNEDSTWFITAVADLIYRGQVGDGVPLSLQHQAMMRRFENPFIVILDSDWEVMAREYPELYAALYASMLNDTPRTMAGRKLARLRSHMSTYAALTVYCGYRFRTYAPMLGYGKYLLKPWSLFTFLQLTRKYMRDHNDGLEA